MLLYPGESNIITRVLIRVSVRRGDVMMQTEIGVVYFDSRGKNHKPRNASIP